MNASTSFGAFPFSPRQIDQSLDLLTRAPALFGSSKRLLFPPTLERAYHEGARARRQGELRLTIGLGIGLDLLTACIDFVVVPDLVQVSLIARVLSLLPLIWLFKNVNSISDDLREYALTIGCGLAILLLLMLARTSQALYAPFAYATAVLGLIYTNTVFQIRFDHSLWLATVFSVALFFASATDEQVGFPLAFALSLQGAIAATFSVIANYRMERIARINYLYSARDAARTAALAADRDKLETLSNTDQLTGLSNRQHFEAYFDALRHEGPPRNTAAAVLMIDIDHFKHYNDVHGHLEGDRCLQLVAAAMKARLSGPKDLMARYGGEEFIVLLYDITPNQALAVAERMRLTVEAIPASLDEPAAAKRPVTISVGVATTTLRRTTDLRALIKTADEALYASKRGGRNCSTMAA